MAEIAPDFFTRFERDRAGTLSQLSLQFCCYMTEQQMSFVCSQAVWGAIFDFLEGRKHSKEQWAHPESYFALEQTLLEQSVAELVGGLLSPQQATGFAVLWGIPYLYEFLRCKAFTPKG